LAVHPSPLLLSSCSLLCACCCRHRDLHSSLHDALPIYFQHSGPVLITHWGLSGPAVLKTSAWAARYLYDQEYRFVIKVNWLHPLNEQQVRSRLNELRESHARKQVDTQDRFPLPNRLWTRLLKLHETD